MLEPELLGEPPCTAGPNPWSRRTTGSRLNERSRSARIVSRCCLSAFSITGSASGATDSLTASSISAIPDIDCTGPSWRKSASRRRSSCSAVTICSESRARSASRIFASSSSRAFSLSRAAKSASTVARATSARANGGRARGGAHRSCSSRTRSGTRIPWRPFGELTGCSSGPSSSRLRVEQALRLAPARARAPLSAHPRRDLVHRLDQRLEERSPARRAPPRSRGGGRAGRGTGRPRRARRPRSRSAAPRRASRRPCSRRGSRQGPRARPRRRGVPP